MNAATDSHTPRDWSRLIRLAIVGLVVAAIAAVAIPWVYINLIKEDPPKKFSFDQLDAVTTTFG